MSDLTDEELDEWTDDCTADCTCESSRALREIRRHRAAQSASAERVRSVVREAFNSVHELAGHPAWPSVARYVASQLAVPVLSAEERDDLSYLVGWCNASAGDVTVERQRFDRGVAALDLLLDRLLGASR
jgi:hypothetical protein